MHASKSWICLVSSSILFLGSALICKYYEFNVGTRLLLFIISLIIILIYSPADTVKRPLIQKKKRIRWKILSVTVSIIYIGLSFIIKDNMIINCLLFGLLIECILILPITYKAFNMPYANYKSYGLNTKK